MKITEQIKALKLEGCSRDTIYQIMAGRLNLFCIAFFGYKGTKAEKSRLRYVWNQINKN